MKYLAFLALLFAGCIVEDGGDSPSPEPHDLTVQEVTEQAIRAEVLGRASAWEAEADRLELDPSRAEVISGETIEKETRDVRLRAARPLNEIMAKGVTPEKLRQAADGARRAVE